MTMVTTIDTMPRPQPERVAGSPAGPTSASTTSGSADAERDQASRDCAQALPGSGFMAWRPEVRAPAGVGSRLRAVRGIALARFAPPGPKWLLGPLVSS